MHNFMYLLNGAARNFLMNPISGGAPAPPTLAAPVYRHTDTTIAAVLHTLPGANCVVCSNKKDSMKTGYKPGVRQ